MTSKPRPPKLILASLETRGLPQQTLSLPVTPTSVYSSNYTIYSQSVSLYDFNSISSRPTSPSLSRSSCRFLQISDFIVRDEKPTIQRTALTNLHLSSLNIPPPPKFPHSRQKKNKEKVKIENAYIKPLTSKKGRLSNIQSSEFLVHRILLKLRDLQFEEAFNIATLLTEERIKVPSIQPFLVSVFRSSILACCESIPVLLLDRGFKLSPNEPVYFTEINHGYLSPSFFMVACAFSLNKVANAMIKKAQVDMPWMGISPLMYAAAQGNKQLLQLLLDNGANPLYSVPLKHLKVWQKALNPDYLTFSDPSSKRLSQTSIAKSFSTFNTLFTFNSELKDLHVFSLDLVAGNACSSSCKTLLSYMPPMAVKKSRFSLLLQQNLQITVLLLSGGVDPYQKDAAGNLPIHLATMAGRLDLVELYLQFGIPIDSLGNQGCTPLHMAVKFQHPRVALALVCLGANKASKNEEGLTPEEIGLAAGLDQECLNIYFDTSYVSSQKLHACFSDPLSSVKSQKSNFFTPSFLRKWVALKKSTKGEYPITPRRQSGVEIPTHLRLTMGEPGSSHASIARSNSEGASLLAKNKHQTIVDSKINNSLRQKIVTFVTKTR